MAGYIKRRRTDRVQFAAPRVKMAAGIIEDNGIDLADHKEVRAVCRTVLTLTYGKRENYGAATLRDLVARVRGTAVTLT